MRRRRRSPLPTKRFASSVSRNAICFRAVLAADANDYRRVVELLDGRTNHDPNAIGLLASARSNLGEHDAGAELWLRVLGFELSESGREQAERNLALTLIAAGRNADARAAVAGILEKEATLGRELLASEVSLRLGDSGPRDERLQKALALAARETPSRLLRRLGDELLSADRPADAAGVYELCVTPEGSEPDAHRLLTALYRAGRFVSALEVCASIPRRVVRVADVLRSNWRYMRSWAICRVRAQSARAIWRPTRPTLLCSCVWRRSARAGGTRRRWNPFSTVFG